MNSTLLKIFATASFLFVAAAAGCTNGSAPPEPLFPPTVAEQTPNEIGSPGRPPSFRLADPIVSENARLVLEGRETFRYDTFGDEAFWGDALKLHLAIVGAKLGGVGEGVSPNTALAVGLKVDSAKIPSELGAAIAAGQVNLDSPATTLALLKLEAVVGLKGTFDEEGIMTSVGITCALCHSTVDDSFAAGIGRRRDGWANRDLNVGAIVSLSPDLTPIANVLGVEEGTVRKVLAGWGPGKYDAQLLLDGKGFRPDGKTAAVVLPPAFGLAGVNLHTYTGFGSVPYWNAYVAVVQMHGQGNFFDPRLDNAEKYPIAAKNKTGHTRVETDLVEPKLAGLQAYQLSLAPPRAPEGSFSPEAAQRGALVFNGDAKCSSCHMGRLFTEPGYAMHTAQEIGIDDFQALRSPDEKYRTTPLRGLWSHQKGGFYHDGRFATLDEVVTHYVKLFSLDLDERERHDLIEYLLSI